MQVVSLVTCAFIIQVCNCWAWTWRWDEDPALESKSCGES